jgi:hypothetical protein
VPDLALRDPAVVAHARLVVIGGSSHCLHEELITAGGDIREGSLRRLNPKQVTTALAAGLSDAPAPDVQRRLAALWPELKGARLRSLEVRLGERETSLRALLADRAAKETGDMTNILAELERTIRAELDELTGPGYVQLQFWTPPEKEQLQRNVAALQARLSRLPEEIRQETDLIGKRYGDLQFRLFPVAVTFLVPERLAMGR